MTSQADLNFPLSATWEYTWEIVCKGFNNLISNKDIASSVLSVLQNPAQLIVFYKDTDPLVSALYFTTGLIIIHYVMSEITKNYSQVGEHPNI